MSLLDDLRGAANSLDIQFQPAANEIQKLLGALIHYSQHGDQFLQAAEKGVGDVTDLLQPQAEEDKPAGHPADPTSPAGSPVAVGAGGVPPAADAPPANT